MTVSNFVHTKSPGPESVLPIQKTYFLFIGDFCRPTLWDKVFVL